MRQLTTSVPGYDGLKHVRILILDSGDSNISGFVINTLAEHYLIEKVSSYKSARSRIQENRPDLFISISPSSSGNHRDDLIAEWEADSATRTLPILVLTPREKDSFDACDPDSPNNNDSLLSCADRELMTRVRSHLLRGQLKAANQRALESEALNCSILQSSRDRISVLDLEGRLLSMNETGQNILKIEDIRPYLNRPWLDLWSGTDRELAEQALQTARAGKEGVFEGFLSTATGDPKWWDVIVSPVLGAGDKPERLLVVSRDVTERHLSAAFLQASDARFSRLFEDVPAGIYRTTPDGQVLLANPMLLHMLGYSSFEELAQVNLERQGVSGTHNRQAFKRDIEAKGEVRGRESAWLRKDGSSLIVRENARAIRNAEGQTIYYDGAVEDITEARKVVQALQESEERMRVALLNSALIVYNTDRDLRCTWIHRAHRAFVRDRIIGKFNGELFPSQTLPELTALQKRVLQTGIGERQELCIEMFGSQEYYDVTAEPLRDKDGSIQGITVSAMDVTERARNEAERTRLLKAEQERVQQLRGLAQAAIQITAVSSVDLILKVLTEQARTLIGVRKATTTLFYRRGQPAISITSTEQNTCWKTGAAEPDPSYVEISPGDRAVPLLRNDAFGSRFLPETDTRSFDDRQDSGDLLTVSLVDSEGEVGRIELFEKQQREFTASDKDILIQLAELASIALDTKRLTDGLEKTNTALARANADLEQFAYSASHDLREPLRTVALYSQLLKQQYGERLDEDADVFIGYVVSGAKRMEALVRDLLAYVQAANATEETDCRADASLAFTRAVSNLNTAIEESGAFVNSDPLPVLTATHVHLEQLFQNLIGNALKYRSANAPYIKVTASQKGEEWEFCVTDNGIGIDLQYQKQIFGIFKRLHGGDTYSGTGIGLAICQRIVERYGGRIWVNSEPGQGSRFHFTLPACEVAKHA